MPVQPQLDPEIKRLIEQEVAQQIERRLQGLSGSWSREKMQAAMRRIEERRKYVTMPGEELDRLIEENRREMGRGPLTDDNEDSGA